MKCEYCSKQMVEATITTCCFTTGCYNCLARAFNTMKKCPTCLCPGTTATCLKPNKYVEDILKERENKNYPQVGMYQQPPPPPDGGYGGTGNNPQHNVHTQHTLPPPPPPPSPPIIGLPYQAHVPIALLSATTDSTASTLSQRMQPDHPLFDKLVGAAFFIIKSHNQDNLDISIKNKQWATTMYNQRKLNEVYVERGKVILIFSVNKSSHFQGVATMTSKATSTYSSEWNTEGKYVYYIYISVLFMLILLKNSIIINTTWSQLLTLGDLSLLGLSCSSQIISTWRQLHWPLPILLYIIHNYLLCSNI